MNEVVEIEARRGAAVRLPAGQSIRVVNTHGGQVVDMWAFRAGHPEHMSMPHSVVTLGRIKPLVGDTLVSDQRRPMMHFVEDRSPGTHCMLFAACDKRRYELLGVEGGRHDNCADNLRTAAKPLGIALPYIPTPLNLFMNTRFHRHREMTVEAPEAKIGDSVTFRAEHDCIVVLSACPQDLIPVNAHGCTPQPVGYSILG
jgi:uncharacterized protein